MLTGMAETRLINSASNSRVKPLSGRAHGTRTFLTPHLVAADPWHSGVQVGLVLEEVEMAPGHLVGIVRRTVGRTAGRAGKPAAGGEVDLDVEPARHGIEVAARHRPGWHDTQGQLQQAGVAHVVPSQLPRPARAWRRARRRQGRFAPLRAVACGHP